MKLILGRGTLACVLLLLPDVILRCFFVISTSSDRQRPTYRLNFMVNYSAVGDQTVSYGVTAPTDDLILRRCGGHYATALLTSLVQLKSWLETLCQNAIVMPTDPRAVVQMLHGKWFKIETNVDLSGSHLSFSEGNASIVACASVVNETLQNVTCLDLQLRLGQNNTQSRSRVISFIEGTNECPPVAMIPTRFQPISSHWICDDNYHYNRDQWECYRNNTEDKLTTSHNNSWATASNHQWQTTTPSSSSVDHQTSSDGLDARISHSLPASMFNVTSRPEMTTEFDTPQSKYWGIESLENVSRIRLSELDMVYMLPLRLWYNYTLICQDEPACEISLAISVEDNVTHPELKCRQTGQNIQQVALKQSHVMPWSSLSNFCRLPFPPNETIISNMHLFLKAVVDHKYDGMQTRFLKLSLVKKTTSASSEEKELLLEIPVEIEDMDRKATCQSINDPHITTFDGLEYNNFFEGEFILYHHQTLPFRVHAIYQKCEPNLPASCNCGVAVQSGDDVIVIDSCRRRQLPVPDFRNRWSSESGSAMVIQLYLNGDLTPGTKIHEDADGKKYLIYLPHGAYVKVITSGLLMNLWIVPSPNDLYSTRGLCGTYDMNRVNDFHLRNGTVLEEDEELNVTDSGRPHPARFLKEWRVDMGTRGSLFRGVVPEFDPYEPKKYCICDGNGENAFCDFAADINRCDIYQGRDVTQWLIDRAITNSRSVYPHQRTSRDINDNSVLTESRDEPIVIDENFVPPKFKWKNSWNEVVATDFCRDYIKDKYAIGRLCSQIPTVNFRQEITTCSEDIKITGNTSWADSARDAMKEQCIEEVQKNGTLPPHIVQQISNAMCFNDCSGHGICRNGSCHCNVDYGSSDCSIPLGPPPDVNKMSEYGLCDVHYMSCRRVIVYGRNFIDSVNLTCHLQRCRKTDRAYEPMDETVTTAKATFIGFNAVECPIPSIHVYLIRVSNNGMDTSEALLFLPFDSICNTCDVFDTACVKKKNSCIIDGICYNENEVSPTDKCLVCKSNSDEYQWATVANGSCYLSDWVVALGAAVGGSLIGVIAGSLLYCCCCRRPKLLADDDIRTGGRMDVGDCSGFETDLVLHRSCRIPYFSSDPFADLDPYRREAQEPTPSVFYNDGRGVENGVDSATYF